MSKNAGKEKLYIAKTKPEEEMVDLNEMARLFGIPYKTLYSHISKGLCGFPLYQVTPTRKVARKVDVLKWLEAVKIPAGVAG